MSYLPRQMIRTIMATVTVAAMVMGLQGCASDGAPEPFDTAALVWPGPEEPRFYWEQTLRSSTDIVDETSEQRLKRIATGEAVAGKPLEKPYGVAAYDGYLFISDTIGRRVRVFDIPGKRYYEIGDKGVGALAKPLEMAVANKLLYVCDNSGRRVAVFDFEGNFIRSIGNSDDLERPSGVAVNADGSRIFIVDTGGVSSTNHRVVVYDGGGEKLFEIGGRGNKPGQMNLPISAAVSPNGNLYVVDGGNFRVQSFDQSGAFVHSFGEVGRMSGHFARPKAIAADSQGNVYVTDSAFANFQIFDPTGRLLLAIGTRGENGTPGQFMLPAGIAVDPTDGRVYVVDQFFRKVEVFRPVGTPEQRPPRPPAKPQANKAAS